jgi:hypothetical protein
LLSSGVPALRPVLLIAAAVATVALAAGLINGFPHGLTYDDAYFYTQIAYNLGTAGRSSFDGVGTTSGYHLLWGGVLAALSAGLGLVTTDRLAHLFLFEVAFVALAFWVAVEFFDGILARFCVLVFVVMGTLLMETLLLSGLLLLLARAEAQRGASRVTPAALAAVLLVPLARIDAALIVAIYGVLLAIRGERRAGAAFLAAVAGGVALQIGLMLWLFGEPFSVSAMIKAGNADPGGALRASVLGPSGVALGYVIRFALFAGLAAAAMLVGFAGWRSDADRRLLFLAAGTVAFAAGHAVSQMMPFWCYLPAYLVLLYAITRGTAPEPLPAWVRRLTVTGTALLGVAFLAHKVFLYRSQIEIVTAARAFVETIPAHVPADARIYQIDGSGFTGFFSGRAVVNGDGLVNTYTYARRARANRLEGYLDEQRICYVITNVNMSGDPLVDFGGLQVPRQEVEELTRTSRFGAFPTTDFVLYRRKVDGCM